MTKKEYLQQYKTLDNYIDSQVEELEKWKSRATKITPTYSDMPKGGGTSDKIQSAVENIIEIQQNLNKSIDRLVYIQENILMSALSTNDPKAYDLIRYKYINGMSWKEIASKLGIKNADYVRTDLHRKAIDKITIYCA